MAEQFNITPKFDLSGLPQYAENDKADVKSDAIYASNDEFLCVKKRGRRASFTFSEFLCWPDRSAVVTPSTNRNG